MEAANVFNWPLIRLRSGPACITFATGDMNPSLGVLRLRGTDVVRALADITHQDQALAGNAKSARCISIRRPVARVSLPSSNPPPLICTAVVSGE